MRIVLVVLSLLATTGETANAHPAPSTPACVPCDPGTVQRFLAELQESAERATAGDPGRTLEESRCRPGAAGEAALEADPESRMLALLQQLDAGTYDELRELCAALTRQGGAFAVEEYAFRDVVFATEEILSTAASRSGGRLHIVAVASSRPNVRILSIPGCDDRVMVFNRHFLWFSYLGWQYFGDLVARVEGDSVIYRTDAGAIRRAAADTVMQGRFKRYALSAMGLAQSPAPAGNALLVAQGRFSRIFAAMHEVAHFSRRHDGELAGAPGPGAPQDGPPAAAGDTLWSGELIYRWSQELEADYLATGFYLKLLENDEPATIRAFRWFPLLLMADLESYGHLQRLFQNPDARPPWRGTEATDAEIRRRLESLPPSPGADDFAEVLLDLDLADGYRGTHPPAHVRMEVVRLALLRNGAITPAEYAVPSPGDRWRLVLRTLYNDFARRLDAAGAAAPGRAQP